MEQTEFNYKADMHRHWLQNPVFGVRADFTHAELKNIHANGLDLTGAIFDHSNVISSDFSATILERIHAYKANFYEVDLTDTNFKEAYLFDANFEKLSLSDADFWNATGNGSSLISIQIGGKNACYSQEFLQVNCKKYTLSDLWYMSKTDLEETLRLYPPNEITEMIMWWNQHSELIKQIIVRNPAKSTK